MTKEQALIDYEDAGKMIDQLMVKRQNLKKIIFSEVGVPQTVIPKHDRMQGNVRSGKARPNQHDELICLAIQEHGEMTQRQVAEKCGLRVSQVNGCLFKLRARHIVHSRKVDGKALWSMAIHKDQRDLNHL